MEKAFAVTLHNPKSVGNAYQDWTTKGYACLEIVELTELLNSGWSINRIDLLPTNGNVSLVVGLVVLYKLDA